MNRDPLLDFSGKVVLITGAGSGFGALLAEELGARGARLVLGDINETSLMALADKLITEGVELHAQRCDVSHEEDCAALVQAAVNNFEQLDIAVNNAGIAPAMCALEDTDESVLDLQHKVNVKGVFFGIKHQLKVMKPRRNGIILNVSSMAGLGGAPKVAAYSAAKHAVIGITKTAAVENAKHNIRVNAVCPFYTLTPMITDAAPAPGLTPEQTQEFLARGCPMKRLGEPEEVVNAMLMLCSPGLSYVTGQALAIDGGVSAV